MVLLLCYDLVNGQPLKRLNHVAYNVNEGLLQSHITDLAEDGSGFIWLSSVNSVQRFDGKSFKKIAIPGTGKNIVNNESVRLFRLKNGNLLLSRSNDIIEYNSQTHHFTLFLQLFDTRSFYDIKVIGEEEGAIWCFHDQKGFFRVNKNNRSIIQVIPTDTSSLIVSRYRPLHLQPHHRFLVVYNENLLQVADKISGKLSGFAPLGEQRIFYEAVKLADDSLLVATARGIELFHCPTGKFEWLINYKSASTINNRHVAVRLLPVRPGACLVSEFNELYEMDLQKNEYSFRIVNQQNFPFFSVGYVTGIRADSHNNIWLLSQNEGIYKINYHPTGFRYFGTAEKKDNFVKTLYVDKQDNRVLYGSFSNGLFIFDSSRRLLYAARQLPGTDAPFTIVGFRKMGAHQYLVFVTGTWNVYLLDTKGFTIRKINTDTRPIREHLKKGDFPDYYSSIFPLNDSVTLMNSGRYVYKLIWTPAGSLRIEELAALPSPSRSAMLSNETGLWVGSRGKYYRLQKPFTSFSGFNHTASVDIRSFCDNENGETWMGADNGLYLLGKKGNIIKSLRKADGLPDETIYALQKDKEGHLWFSHNRGLSCYKTDGRFLHFTKADGLQDNEFNTNASVKTTDGELFFGGVNGVSSFYSESVTRISEKPSTLLTEIKVGGHLWKGDTSYWTMPGISLKHNQNNLSLAFTAIGNRSAEQYNYQYRLNPVDGQWTNAGNDAEIRYVLQPGRYILSYYAGNSFEENPVGAKELIIVIKPPFWKTTWFITAALAFAGILIAMITRKASRHKLKKKLEELERNRMVNAERLRISQEMHDDIGAGLTQITMLSEAAKGKADNEQQLDKIANTGRKLVSDMSEIIWSMNPEQNTLDQLLAYLREQLRQLLEYSGISYTIDFPENGINVSLTNAQKRNLLLVAKEIVHNAVKHSKAKKINIKAEQKKTSLHFIITDDGCGFDTLQTYSGNGLRNIKKRIEELGGTLEMESTPLNGCRYRYEIPLQAS